MKAPLFQTAPPSYPSRLNLPPKRKRLFFFLLLPNRNWLLLFSVPTPPVFLLPPFKVNSDPRPCQSPENPADARVKNETLDWLSPPLPPLFFVFPSEMKWGKRGGGTLLSHPTPREAESLFFFCRRCQSTGGGGGGRAFFCCMGEWKKTGEGRKIKSWEGGGGTPTPPKLFPLLVFPAKTPYKLFKRLFSFATYTWRSVCRSRRI